MARVLLYSRWDADSKEADDSGDRTVIAANVGPLVKSLSVSPEGFRHELIRLFHSEDLEFDHPEFDGLFWVCSEEPAEGRELLSREVRNALVALAPGSYLKLEIQDGVVILSWSLTHSPRMILAGLTVVARIVEAARALHEVGVSRLALEE
ncbi:MAG: hypothetical protein KAI47_00210 [Deltaproteobacteria bacterium]|nr:hypothetical protein [Deltaproteobacteria bacterium]